MKFCIDCKHAVIPEKEHPKYTRCKYNNPISLVTGEIEVTELLFCQVVRQSVDPLKCGVEGRFYEEKEADENGVIHTGIRIYQEKTNV